MEEEKNFVELRSEEVQEILGTPPHWLVQWGTVVVVVGFGLLVSVATFLEYPDVVSSEKLTLTTAEPPVEVVARVDGRITQLLVPDTSQVSARQPLAVLQSTARYEDVVELNRQVQTWSALEMDALRGLVYSQSLQLGELQSDYSQFIRDLEDFKFGRDNRGSAVEQDIGSIQLQIKQLNQSITFEQKAMRRNSEQLSIAQDFYERQKNLFKQGLIAETKLEEERLKLAEIERERDLHESYILEKNREIIRLRSSINTANVAQAETSSSASMRLQASLLALRSAIDKWLQVYVLSAPMEGKVVFNGLMLQQFVRNGESVMTVVPQSKDKIVGRVLLPVEKSGKVSVGQRVVMKLDNYPYQEYGTLEGKVASKSSVPKNREYLIIVEQLAVTRKGNMRSSTRKEIPFEQQLLGTADIITEDKGFLARVVEQVTAGF